MKKLLFIFFTLIIFANVSYASFPVSDALKLNQDTLQTEEIKQYHSSLIKMGVDLNDCRCESCRAGIPISVELINQDVKIPVDYHKFISKFFLITGAIGMTIMLYGKIYGNLVGVLGMYILIPSLIVLLINFIIMV
jgi:hypothetical protein